MALRDELATVRGEVDLERDRVLVARSQGGDGSAFAELYTCYHDRLQRFCNRRLHDGEEAADVTQEAFTRAWRALPAFAGERRFYPWLTVIAGNLCTDLLRKQARSQPTDDLDRLRPRDHEPAAAESTEDSVMAAVDGELVVRALGKLSDRHRRVLALREGSGLTYQEIATHEGLEISTVETLLWRARRALKREYAALSGGGALGALVLAAGTVRRLAGRLARRVAVLPVARGGGVAGSLAVALTAAAVATVAFLPAGAGPRPASPAAPSASAPSASAGAGATIATVASPPPAERAGTTPDAAPQPPGAPAGGATPSASVQPGAVAPAGVSPPSVSAASTVGSADPDPVDPSVGAVSGLDSALAPAIGDVASATTWAVTDLAGSVTQPVSGAVGSAVSAVGELVPAAPSPLGADAPATTGGSTTSSLGQTAGGLLSSRP